MMLTDAVSSCKMLWVYIYSTVCARMFPADGECVCVSDPGDYLLVRTVFIQQANNRSLLYTSALCQRQNVEKEGARARPLFALAAKTCSADP